MIAQLYCITYLSSHMHSAAALIGEAMTVHDMVGGALIMLGCLVNEVDLLAAAKSLMTKMMIKDKKQ